MVNFKKGTIISFKGRLAGFFNNNILKYLGIVICGTVWNIGRKRKNYIYNNDYIRCSSLELISHEIYRKNLQGNVAELGVFQGHFAKCINESFPDRKLYLFDTFEGFNEKDIKIEYNGVNDLKINNTPPNYIHDFSKTSIELVLKKMKYKENCIIKKGYFPETAKDVEDEFVFVSIDVDLYEPIYNGLCYFYPRLKHGGYIFIHDYNERKIYSKVKDAVRKYCNENKINFFPLSDICGSAVIIK